MAFKGFLGAVPLGLAVETSALGFGPVHDRGPDVGLQC